MKEFKPLCETIAEMHRGGHEENQQIAQAARLHRKLNFLLAGSPWQFTLSPT